MGGDIKALVVDLLKQKYRDVLPVIRAEAVQGMADDRVFSKRPVDPSVEAEALEGEIGDALLKRFRQHVKKLTADCLASVFWESLRGHLQYRHAPAVSTAQLGRVFGLARSTIPRWAQKTTADPSRFFVALVNWHVDGQSILLDWPTERGRGSKAPLFNPASYGRICACGVALTVEKLRVREEKLPRHPLTLDELRVISVIKTVPGAAAFVKPDLLPTTEVAVRVRERLRVMLSPADLKAWDDKRISEVAHRWLLSFALFDEARPVWSVADGK